MITIPMDMKVVEAKGTDRVWYHEDYGVIRIATIYEYEDLRTGNGQNTSTYIRGKGNFIAYIKYGEREGISSFNYDHWGTPYQNDSLEVVIENMEKVDFMKDEPW